MNKANIIPQDDQTTPGEGHPEDETTGGAGRMRTVVAPNPKCMGCLHYDNTRSHCLVALAPASCGDGSKPETGYAPMVPDEEAYQEWRAKRGLAHNAPRGTVSIGEDGSGSKGPVGGPQGAPDFVVQVLGDEGHVQLSEEPGDLSKGVKAGQSIVAQVKHPKQSISVVREPRRMGAVFHVMSGSRKVSMGHHSKDSAVAAAQSHLVKKHGAGGTVHHFGKSVDVQKGGTEKCMKCGYAMKGVGADCKKCKYKSLRNTVAFDSNSQADRVGGPVNKGEKRSSPGWPGNKLAWKRNAMSGPKKPKQVMPPGQRMGRIARKPGQKVSTKQLKYPTNLGKAKKPQFGHGHFDYIGVGDTHVVVNEAKGKHHKGHKEKMKRVAEALGKGITWGAIKRTAKRTGPGMPGYKYSGSATEKVVGKVVHAPGLSAAQKKKNEASLKRMTKMPKKLYKAGDPWAIATAAWQKVSPGKKAKYTKQAMARHRKAGEDVHASKYAKRAPREFMERLAKKGGGSLIEEFGQGLGGFLYKARHDLLKAALAAMPKLKAPGMKQGYAYEHEEQKTVHTPAPAPASNLKREVQGQPQATEQAKNAWSPGQHVMGAKVNPQTSPVLHAVRTRQMKNPSPASQAKARQAGGGKVFSHSSLAQHAGVKPENIADLAHASQHVHDFHNKVRKEFGDKVKHLTSAQIRSAYHSTGLEHSLTIADLDLIKAHKAGKRHVVGHTSTGKPIHSDGHMAEGLKGEEHSEAGELHESISQRLSDAAFGHTFGGGRGKLPAAAHKYLMGLSDHHRELARRHRASYPEGSMLTPIAPAEPFGKSLPNNPTDAEIAKAMMSGGGAGALISSGHLNAPMNFGVDTSSTTYGLPAVVEKVELQEEPKKEAPRRAPIVGGVLSAAWDLGQPLDE